ALTYYYVSDCVQDCTDAFIPTTVIPSSLFCPHRSPRYPLSFPTRRSSDLSEARAADTTWNAGPVSTPCTKEVSTGRRDSVRREKDRKSTRLNSSHANIAYAVFCLRKKRDEKHRSRRETAGGSECVDPRDCR